MNDQNLTEFLKEKRISFERFEHPAVYTCEEARDLIPHLPGTETKNLFVRDRKGKRHFLIVVPDHKVVDLKALANLLETSRLSMDSAERLKQYLGIEPGAVSILALFNDHDRCVEVVVDREIWQADACQFHPLVNTSTLVISHEGIAAFLESLGYEVLVADVPGR